MALEASDRLIDIIESIGGVPVAVFQGLPSNSVPLCLTSWEDQKKSAKTSEKKIVDLHKSGTSLGAISKCLKVPRSSVQTIVCKYKHHGVTQSTAQEGDAFCLLEMYVLWCKKCKSIPEQQQRTL